MPWMEVSTVSARCEFLQWAVSGKLPFSVLCQRFGISRKTGYKWLHRYEAEGFDGLQDRSRRPIRSPSRTASAIEMAVLAERDAHPVWGGRKIRARLRMQGFSSVPSPSTITAILKRHGLIDPAESQKRQAFQRFEHEAPNVLWQMDFKGHFPTRQGRCHPLTVLDDHSRFSIGIQACDNERGVTVQRHLTRMFDRYGLPERMLMDNGPPFGAAGMGDYTVLTVWLIRLGIAITHGRPYHPQTQGKEERFHRTLKAEVLRDRTWRDLAHCQHAFDQWRDVYNLERPHQALDMMVPAHRYRPSSQSFPPTLPPIEYGPDDAVRKVQGKGEIHFRGRVFRISRGLFGQAVGLRPTADDGQFDVYFCHQRVGQIDLNNSGAKA